MRTKLSDIPENDFTIHQKIAITKRYFFDMLNSFGKNAHVRIFKTNSEIIGLLDVRNAFFTKGDEAILHINAELKKSPH